jgi:hypothetical protein
MWLYALVAVVMFVLVVANEGMSPGLAICLGVSLAAVGGVVLLARKNPKRAS